MYSARALALVNRCVGQQRRNLSMFDNKYVIKEVREKYYKNHTQGAADPTYLKEPTDKIMVAVGFTGLFTGITIILNGLWSMAHGINKL